MMIELPGTAIEKFATRTAVARFGRQSSINATIRAIHGDDNENNDKPCATACRLLPSSLITAVNLRRAR